MLVLISAQQSWTWRLEYAIYDKRISDIRKETVLSDTVRVVLIDESSLAYMSPSLGSFPWPRTVYAELIEFFALGGAKAVLFDILFTEPEATASDSQEEYSVHDQQLAMASEAYPGTVHAMLLTKDVEDESGSTLNNPLPVGIAEKFALPVSASVVSGQQNTYSLPIPIIAQSTPHIGVVGLDPDEDGIYRRVKPLWKYQNAVFPAFALTPLLLDKTALTFRSEDRKLNVQERSIPLDDTSQVLVNFYGEMNPISIARVFQAWDQITKGEVESLALDPFSFENKIVLIGASAIGLQDTKPVINDTKAPGVYVHAALLSNILEDDLMRPVQTVHTQLAVAIMVLIAVVLAFNIPWLWLKMIFLVGTPLLWWWLSGWALVHNLQLNVTQPLTGFALGWSWSFTYLSVTEGASKRRVKRMLSQYVSPAMLDEVLAQRDEILHAGVGKTETLSILFSDVRGFTKISETLPAEKVVTLLNCHFSEMADAIFNNFGTLDKFIGDAIMAYWGAPIPVSDHADRSVKAALDMMRALDTVNQRLAEMGLPSIEIGIGINTGDVVLGNIGSDRKLDYTVIGDAVNVASRMEGITKMYGVPVVISETTRMALNTPRPCVLLDYVRVKGKTEPMAIYLPLPDAGDSPTQYASHCEMAILSQRAFAYYQSQQWDKAEALYRDLHLDSVRALFLSRILEFRRQPPPFFWDGVYTFTTK